MRKFFMTDIHGNHLEMMRLLEEVKFDNKKDCIVFGGDHIDRGPDSARVTQEIMRMQKETPKKTKAVLGNHEEMMLWYLNSRSAMWLQHGGLEAIQSFNQVVGKNEEELMVHVDWMRQLPIFVEDETFVYTHAGFDPYFELSEQKRDVIWMEKQEFYFYEKQDILEKTKGRIVIHGHTPVERIVSDGARMDCDLGASVWAEGKVALVDLTHGCYYSCQIGSNLIEKRKIE